MRSEHVKFSIPEYCHTCASTNIVYTENKVLYGKNYGEWPMIYYCKDCRASVGCHPNSNIPLGVMADKETKALRKLAHASFDQLWKNGYMNRTKAYHWLSGLLNIPYESCHMSQLSKEQLKEAERLSREYLQNNLNALERRKEKRNTKRVERNERNFQRTKRHIRERTR